LWTIRPGVNIRRRIGRKSSEWLRRYLPNEIVGTVGELGGAGVAYLMTGSFVAAAIAGTVGASVGYYAVAYGTAVRWCYAAQYDRAWPVRVLIANLLALRSVVVEFGPAEGIDSLVVRPLTYYVGPIVLGNALLGWIAAKILSDCAFYVCAIASYERFRRLIVRRRPQEGAHHEPTAALTDS
jgi:hypothetical protein